MKSLVLFLCTLIVVVWSPVPLYATCPPIAPACPLGIAETDPPTATPQVCSGKGTCVLGACKCNTGFADVDCGAVLRRTKLANLVITQAGLDDGPTRYFDIITQLVTLLQQSGDFSIPAQDILSTCTLAVLKTPDVNLQNVDLTLKDGSIAAKVLNGGIQSSGAMHMIIPVVPLDAAISKFPGIGTCCDNSGKTLQASSTGCAVACASSKGDHVSFNMDVHFSINIFPTIDPVTGAITVSVPPDQIVITFDPPDMGFVLSCDLSQFENLVLQLVNTFVVKIGTIVAGQVLVKIKQLVADFTKTFSITGVGLNITDDISATGFLTSADFVADSHMALDFEGILQKNRFGTKNHKCPQVITTFVDRTVDGKNLPNARGLADFFAKDDAGTPLQTFFGGQLTRSAMTVGVAALFQDNVELINTLTSLRLSFSVLDATFTGGLDVGLPQFGFPAKSARSGLGNGDFLEAAISSGNLSLTCNETGASLFASNFERGALNVRPVLIANLDDFEKAFSGQDAVFKATLQIFDLDVTQLDLAVQAPVNVTIPNALATGLSDKFLGGSKMLAANQLLEKFAVVIPPQLSNLAPGPRLESLHDSTNPGSDGKNGFFQFSTRCACVPANNNQDLFFVIDTQKFGKEIVPRCIAAKCPTSAGRRLEETTTESNQYKLYPARAYFEEQRRVLAAASGNDTRNTTDFIATGKCGSDAGTLKLLVKPILICAERTDAASFARLTAKAQCMQEQGVTFDSALSLSACDPQNTQFNSLRQCEAPVNIIMRDLFGQTCTEGSGFSCGATLSAVIADACTCFDTPKSSKCNDNALSFVVLALGWAIPLVVLAIILTGLRFVEGCCVGRMVSSEEEKVVSFFAVKLSRQDKYFLGLTLMTVVADAILTVGWVFDDPFKAFISQVVNEDIFTKIPWVTTTVDDFSLGWSLAILFSFAFAGSSLLGMFLYSFMVGRCAWLGVAPNQAFLRTNDEWFIPTERTAAVWTRNAIRLQWINRLSVFFVLTSIFAPAVFFAVRTSVKVFPPQFDPFVDRSNATPESQVLGNLTSLATSQGTLDLIGEALGFTVMSSFLGFLSSVVLLIIQGMVPATFSTASVALYWIDSQMRQERQQFEILKHQQQPGVVTLPPDTADKNRWKRVLHFFAWSAHAGGALGSLIGAIFIFQSLRAPPAWAILWMTAWIVTLPFILLLVGRKDDVISGRRRLMVAVGNFLLFFAFTIGLVALSPPLVSFASPLAVIFFIVNYLYGFLLLISEYCNLGSSSTAVTMGAGRVADMDHMSHQASSPKGFEVGYSFAAIPPSSTFAVRKQQPESQTPPRIKSVMVVGRAQPHNVGGRNGLVSRRFHAPHFDFEERDINGVQKGANNPGFAHSREDADEIEANVGHPPFVLPPNTFGLRNSGGRNNWAPPIWSPMANPLMMPFQQFQQQNPATPGFSIDTNSLRRAADRVSTRYSSQPNLNSQLPSDFWKSRISKRLESRGFDPSLQDEMANKIALFASQNERPSDKIMPYSMSPPTPERMSAEGRLGVSKQLLQNAVARTRQSISHWGEDRPLPPQRPADTKLSKYYVVNLLLDNRVMDVLLERTERRENTYGLRVVPYRRMIFFVGLLMLFVVLLNSTAKPLSVKGIKELLFQIVIGLLVPPGTNSADITAGLDFNNFDQLTVGMNPPLQAYVDLAKISFYLLWVVFLCFFLSFVIEVYSCRFCKTLDGKRKGIRIARMFSFAQLPFLFIAVVVPSSADYISLSLGSFANAVPICADQFNRLVFSVASNLFGTALGGLLAVQTMLVLLLIVPSVMRALAFVIAKEIFDLNQVLESSKAYISGEKRLMIARFLWRSFPSMTPVLLYIPLILIAQVVAQVYSSILVYFFFVLPLVTSRFRLSKATKDQKPYRWILFSTVWVGWYFMPLGVIGLAEIIQFGQFGFLAVIVLKDFFLYATVVAEVSLAVVVMSDMLYLFIASDEEAEADRYIDRYMDVIEEEANKNTPFMGNRL